MSKFKITILSILGVLFIWVCIVSVNLLACKHEFEVSYETMMTYNQDSIARKEWNDYCCNIAFVMMDNQKMLTQVTYLGIIKERPED